jgi:hypothetical protein
VHVQTFFFVAAVLIVLLRGLSARIPVLEIPVLVVGGAVLLYFFAYLYVAMCEGYRQGHGLTSVKYVVLGGSYLFAAVLTALGAVFVTALTA